MGVIWSFISVWPLSNTSVVFLIHVLTTNTFFLYSLESFYSFINETSRSLMSVHFILYDSHVFNSVKITFWHWFSSQSLRKQATNGQLIMLNKSPGSLSKHQKPKRVSIKHQCYLFLNAQRPGRFKIANNLPKHWTEIF